MPGEGGGGPVGVLVSIISSLFGFGGDGLSTAEVFRRVTISIGSVASGLYGLVSSSSSFLWDIVKKIRDALKWIWDNLFKRLLTKLGNAIIEMHLWLEKHLKPVLDFLLKVKKWLDKMYLRYIRPLLRTIQHIRRFLLILRLLHINFATVLDQKLARIEGTIAHVFLEIRGILNGIIDVVNGLSDSSKLVRVIAATVGGRRVFAGMTRLWTGLPLGHFFPNYSASALPWEKPVTRAADLTDPLRNPSASFLLNSISFADFFSSAEGNPIPTDADIDASSDTYIGAQVIEQFLAGEAALSGAGELGLEIARYVANGDGNLSGMHRLNADTVTTQQPDLVLAVAP